MNCGRVSNQLSAYLDRELTGSEMLQIRSHLSDCDRCRAEYEALGRMKTMLGALRSAEPPRAFVAATVRRFEAAAPHFRAPRRSGTFTRFTVLRRLFPAGAAHTTRFSPPGLTRQRRPARPFLGLLRWQPLTLSLTTALAAALVFTSLVLHHPRRADETVATKPALVIEGLDPEGQELIGSREGADWVPDHPAFRPISWDRLSSGFASQPWVTVSLQGENSWPFH
jgi:anti-sigma factor RsiW